MLSANSNTLTYSFPICERQKGSESNEGGNGDKLSRVDGGETIIRIYHEKEKYFFNKSKKY